MFRNTIFHIIKKLNVLNSINHVWLKISENDKSKNIVL